MNSISEEKGDEGEIDLRTSFNARATPRKNAAFSTDADEDLFHPGQDTPLAKALAANAAISMGRYQKNIQRKWRGMKMPKMKKKNLKKFNVVRQLGHIKHKKEKLFSKNFKGKVIDGVHELYTLTVGMMLGLRCTVGNSLEASKSELVLEDFGYVEKREFKPAGTNDPFYKTPPHQLGHTFKFKSYAPEVFKRVRQFCGIDPASYMMSICGNANFIEFMSNSKSGQFFFYSHDGKYMIKTQSKEENRFMKKILPFYYQFLMENPNSLMVRFLGMHRVKMYHLRRKHHFVIMTSVFDTPLQIHTIFDLKGSRAGRGATEKEKANGGVLKDNDLVETGRRWHLGSKREKLLEQIEKDAMFLASLNIMDYSLLVGVHDRKIGNIIKEAPIEGGAQQPQPPAALSHSSSINNNSNNGNNQNQGTAVVATAGAASASTAAVPSHMRSNTPFRAHAADVRAETQAKREAVEHAERELNGSNGAGASPSNRTQHRASLRHRGGHHANAAIGNTVSSEEVGIAFSGSHEAPPNNNSNNIANDSEEEEDEFYDDDDDEDDEDDDEYDDESDATDSVFGDTAATLNPNGANYNTLSNEEINEREIVHLKEILGLGAKGVEGARVAQLFLSADRFAQMTSSTIERDMELVRHMSTIQSRQKNVFVHRPWTSRSDGGVNSRLTNNEGRGDEVYFMGIIDILQQYNLRKRSETFFKGFTEDVSLISSVPPVQYAKRFVQFLRDNSD